MKLILARILEYAYAVAKWCAPDSREQHVSIALTEIALRQAISLKLCQSILHQVPGH